MDRIKEIMVKGELDQQKAYVDRLVRERDKMNSTIKRRKRFIKRLEKEVDEHDWRN